MSDKCGDCSAGRWPTQQRSQSVPTRCRCAGDAATVETSSTAQVAINSSEALATRPRHMVASYQLVGLRCMQGESETNGGVVEPTL